MTRSGSDSSDRRRPDFRTDIQGLRALAVVLVVVYHAAPDLIPGGFVGVDVFFVISGYLITSNLLREHSRYGRISISRFYARRALRLLPAALLVILATVVASRLLIAPLLMEDVGRAAVASALGVANIWFAFVGANYLALESVSPFQHFWSLGVEEQFYLAWPIIIIGSLWLASRLGRRTLLTILFLLTVSSLAVSIAITSNDATLAYYSPATRAWELAAGGALVVFLRGRANARTWPGEFLTLAGTTSIISSALLFGSETPFPGFAALVPVLGTLALLASSHYGGSALARWTLSSKPAVWIGDRSYSIYLWHWPLIIIPVLLLGGGRQPVLAVIGVALSLLLADFTYRHVELRGIAWGRTPRPRMVLASSALAAGLAVILVLTLTSVGAIRGVGTVASPGPSAVLRGPSSTPVLPENAVPRIEQAIDDRPVAADDGCHADIQGSRSGDCTYGSEGSTERIVLFGDSHAVQWFSPLNSIATERGWELVNLTKSACPAVDAPINNSSLGREYRECADWRSSTFNRIDALAPSVIVLSSASTGYRDLAVDGRPFEEWWGEGLAKTLARLPQTSEVLVLSETPRWSTSPTVCLSAAVEDANRCARPRNELVDVDLHGLEATLALAADADYVETADWLCASTCAPVLWNIIAYRDTNHVTDSLAQAYEPLFARAIQAAQAAADD